MLQVGQVGLMHGTRINISSTLAQIQWLEQKGPDEAFLAAIADKPTGTRSRQRGEKRQEGSQRTRRARLYQFFDRLLIPLKRSLLFPLYMHELANFFGGSTPFVPVKRITVYARLYARFSTIPRQAVPAGCHHRKKIQRYGGEYRYHRSVLTRWNLNLDCDIFDFKRLTASFFIPFFPLISWILLYGRKCLHIENMVW